MIQQSADENNFPYIDWSAPYRTPLAEFTRTARENASRAARHRLDEPARLSLSMVASLQSPPPFHPASSFSLRRALLFSTSVVRIRTPEQGNLSPCGLLLQPCLHS